MLHTLSVTQPLDATGKHQRPKIKTTAGVISYASSSHSLSITYFHRLTCITATQSLSNVSLSLARPGPSHSFAPMTSSWNELSFKAEWYEALPSVVQVQHRGPRGLGGSRFNEFIFFGFLSPGVPTIPISVASCCAHYNNSRYLVAPTSNSTNDPQVNLLWICQ